MKNKYIHVRSDEKIEKMIKEIGEMFNMDKSQVVRHAITVLHLENISTNK